MPQHHSPSTSSAPALTATAHLRARDLRLSRGGRILLDGVDLTLAPGDRLAVVGENGRGKTTLLEALAGRLEPDAGRVERHGSLGTVEQELPTAAPDPETPARRTVGDLLDDLLARPLAAMCELDDAALALSHDGSPGAARRFDEALATATALDAWDAPRRLEVAVEEIGAMTDRERSLTTLSVGERYRVRLAGVIAARDDIWLFDEPTNHLDARGLEHLTRALLEHHGVTALISHDRALLDRVATGFLDLDPSIDGRPLLVTGGLEEWRLTRERARTTWEHAYREQQEEHARLQSQADHARSRLRTGWRPAKGAGKHQRQTRAPGVVRAMNERIDRLEAHRMEVPPPPPRLVLSAADTAAGRPLLRADAVRVEAGEATASAPPRLATTTLRLEGGDRLLVTGPNGAGKTTLLRVLAAELSPSSGTVRMLGGAHVAMLAQEDPGGVGPRAAGAVEHGAGPEHPGSTGTEPPHRGSPGERRRRELARLFSGRPDVALLDEPTNHLGISGVDDLLAALETAPSAVVVATHDRSVLRALAHWPRLELGAGG